MPIFTDISSITPLLHSLNIFLLSRTNFSQVYFKFLRRMMILHLASKCAVSATTLLPSSICYRLHEMFLWESTKNYGQFDKSLLIQLIYTLDRYRCKSLLLSYTDDNIPTSAAIFVYNGAFDIAHSVRNVSGCTLLRDVKLACNELANILWILRRLY